MGTVVVTRHPALVKLLAERRMIAKDVTVLDHVQEPAQIAGKHVIGVLPLHLAAIAAQVTEVPLALTPELRGQELDLDTLRKIAGEAVTYRVTKLT
jgi:putative CRISPR-associated protein (TIGR02620 family)